MKGKQQVKPAGIPPDTQTNDPIRQFAMDVHRGLGASPKFLPCVYLYDEIGSQLFEKICRQPEYYCTRAEREILQKHARDIASHCSNPLKIVELGSGSSDKTRVLLEAFVEARMQTIYVPIDVSSEILVESAAKLRQRFPSLKVKPVAARYEDGLKTLDHSEGSVLLVWLGSSIGNYEPETARRFLGRLSENLSSGDNLLLGVDLIKDRPTLEAAYNDRAGVTAAFNLNILARINRELGGSFDLGRFGHQAVFNAVEGRIEMYLISHCDQQVEIEALDRTVSFSEGERIHTENSHKYDPEAIASLAGTIHGSLIHQWLDSRRYFSLNLFESNSRNAGF